MAITIRNVSKPSLMYIDTEESEDSGNPCFTVIVLATDSGKPLGDHIFRVTVDSPLHIYWDMEGLYLLHQSSTCHNVEGF